MIRLMNYSTKAMNGLLHFQSKFLFSRKKLNKIEEDLSSRQQRKADLKKTNAFYSVYVKSYFNLSQQHRKALVLKGKKSQSKSKSSSSQSNNSASTSQMFKKFGIQFDADKLNEKKNNKNENTDKKNDRSKDDEEDEDEKGNENEKQEKKTPQMFKYILGALMLLFLFSGNSDDNPNNRKIEELRMLGKIITEDEMLQQLSTGGFNLDLILNRQAPPEYSKIEIYQNSCLAKRKGPGQPILCNVSNIANFLQRLETIPIPYNVNFHYGVKDVSPIDSKTIDYIFRAFLFFGLYLMYRNMKKNNVFKMFNPNQMLGLKKFEAIKPEDIKITFRDVAGMHQAKGQITEFVDFLKNPEKYTQMGAKIPKGALLTGPPGTGKTLLAKACAGEAGVPFFYVSGSEFVEKYVGMGANRVRSLFDSAAKSAPSIIFIDEIDAIGKKRDGGPFSNEERDNTLNQLLVNMDGFDTKNKIVVMAATNLKDSLDPALLRPGRFDRSVQIMLPSFDERKEILQVHLKKVLFNPNLDIAELAKKVSILTPGFSGAELANICNEAAILAARNNAAYIELQQFQKATERVMAGLQKRNLFSDKEKLLLAYYECGKAVAGWFTEGADPVIKISIAPFSKSGKGYSHAIKDEIPLRTKEELLDQVVCCLAGRTAQIKFMGQCSSNGQNDLKRARRIIHYIVTKFGMSASLPMIGFPEIEYVRKPYSAGTQAIIDEQMANFENECHARAQKLINQRSQMIQKLKAVILQKQTLSHHQIKEILGDRPAGTNQNYNKFLQEEQRAKEDSKRKPPGEEDGPVAEEKSI